MAKENIWLVLIIIVIFLGAVALDIKKCGQSTISDNQSVDKNALQMTMVPVYQSDGFYNIKVEYPQFKNIDSAFNEKISALIQEKIDTFKKEAKDNWEARKATALPGEVIPENPEVPFDFITTWTPTQLNNKYISFVINIYYFVGGAHGSEEIYTFNYDIAQKKEITINDFLNSSTEALQKLSELSAQDVTSQLQATGIQIDSSLEQMIKKGTEPTVENFKDFNFNYNSLTIYFQKYQVAPGAAGSIKVTFYKNTLDQNSIKSDYLE